MARKTEPDRSEPDRSGPDPSEPDDGDALSWAGDDLRGGIDPLTRNRVASQPEVPFSDGENADLRSAPTNLAGAAATVLFAVLYLAIVVGWILSVQITGSTANDLFSQVAWQFGEFVAIVAGALWYLAVLTLTPDARTAVRVGWFALGVAILLPWPILLVLIS